MWLRTGRGRDAQEIKRVEVTTDPIDGVPSPDLVLGFAYEELRRLARAVRTNRPDATLCTTELVHEAWLKLRDVSRLGIEDPEHVKRIIGRAMRQVLVDGARRRLVRTAHDRTRSVGAPTDGSGTPDDVLAAAVIDLDRAIATLAEMDPRRAAVVECRFFAGMDVEETARALGVGTATVKRDWRVARAWLAQELAGGSVP